MKKPNLYWLATAFIAVCFTTGNCQTKTRPVTGFWRTGVALYSFHTLPYTAAMQKVDSGNIRYVEGFSFYPLGGGYGKKTMGSLSKPEIEKMKDGMRKQQVKMVSMYVAGGNNLAEWKNTFELAKAFGVEYVTGEPQKVYWDMIDSLAGVYKIKVAIHNHAKGISPYWHPDSILAAVKQHPNFGACADIGHWVRSGLDPVKCIQQLKGHILGIHLKDVDGKGAEKAADVKVGTGVINFKKMISVLKTQRYKGMIFVECEHDFGNNLADIVESIDYVNKLARNK